MLRLLLVTFCSVCCALAAMPAVSNRFLAKLLLSSSLFCGLPLASTNVLAAEVSANVIYKSGKNPIPVNANDPIVGSKKDINFLRCMSNCKSKCQLPGEGLAKADCVQDCQDQCCDSYEQCSFKIKTSTIGNSI